MRSAVLPLVAASLTFAFAGSADAQQHCQPISGKFSFGQSPPTTCTSPNSTCEVGEFRGDVKGTYELRALSVVPLSSISGRMSITEWGLSTIVNRDHALFVEAATLESNLFPFAEKPFVTLYNIRGTNTGPASGWLAATGIGHPFDPAGGDGSYIGQICRP